MNNSTIVGIVSGYFAPLHEGHLEYMEAAKKQCDHLIVIINNDYQTVLKGTKKFLDERHRGRIINSLKPVDEVMISIDMDKTVCESLRFLRKKYSVNPILFFNSGDRVKKENTNSKEMELCEELEIKYVAIPLLKIYSSSEILKSLI